MIVVAVDGQRGDSLARLIQAEGHETHVVSGRMVPAAAVADAMAGEEAAQTLLLLARADILVVDADARSLTADLVAAADRWTLRIVALYERAGERRAAELFGIHAVSREIALEEVVAEILHPVTTTPTQRERGRIIAVWGAQGSPGRSTLAAELATELARDGRRVALIDADSHAPSLGIALGLTEEGPGFAAACRAASRGSLTVSELARVAVQVGAVDVLTGINRPSRWPELDRHRVTGALDICRDWVDAAIVDVAPSLEQDEEIISDVDGPRRNAATRAVLETADVVVAVVAADPVGVARFVRAYPHMREAAPNAQIRVVVNKVRAGALGIDGRGQVRRSLERFLAVDRMWFVPWDVRGADAGLLAARPISHAAPRAGLVAAVRRFVGEAIAPPPRTEGRSEASTLRGQWRARSTRRAREGVVADTA